METLLRERDPFVLKGQKSKTRLAFRDEYKGNTAGEGICKR